MELEGNSSAATSVTFLQQLRAHHPEPLIVIWDNGPAHGGAALRDYLTTPDLVRRLRERGESHGGEPADVSATEPGPEVPAARPGALAADDQPDRQRRAAQLGEFPRVGAPAADRGTRANRPTPHPGGPQAPA